MKTKSYIGTSRPIGEYNETILAIIDNNLDYFNKDKQKGILTVEHYVCDGDQWQILLDGHLLLCGMTLNEVFYTTAGIIRYTREMGRK